jgi:hypothetical protein
MKFITMKILSALFFLPIIAAATQIRQEDRQLINLDADTILGLLPIPEVCGKLFEILIAPTGIISNFLSCECSDLSLSSFTISCSVIDDGSPICVPSAADPKVCGRPAAYISVDIIGLATGAENPISLEICYIDIAILGAALPNPLCISVTDVVGGLSADEIAATPCTASVGEEECVSCSLCGSGNAATFNCTNIDPNLVSTSCATDFGIPLVPSDVIAVDSYTPPMVDGI